MSWKEVFKDLSDMEGIVHRMEEEQETESEELENKIDNDRDGVDQGDSHMDLKGQLMREIVEFKK